MNDSYLRESHEDNHGNIGAGSMLHARSNKQSVEIFGVADEEALDRAWDSLRWTKHIVQSVCGLGSAMNAQASYALHERSILGGADETSLAE